MIDADSEAEDAVAVLGWTSWECELPYREPKPRITSSKLALFSGGDLWKFVTDSGTSFGKRVNSARGSCAMALGPLARLARSIGLCWVRDSPVVLESASSY